MKYVKKSFIKEVVLLVLSLFIMSFLINLFWEVFHSLLYNSEHMLNIKYYLVMLLIASLKDGMIILGMYAFVAFLWRDIFWLKRINTIKISLFVFLGLSIATWIEYRAVFLMNKWEYSSSMLTIFGIGFTPLVQLSLTGIISIWLTKKLLYKGLIEKIS